MCSGLPRFAGLSGPEAELAVVVVVEAPERAGPSALTWTVTLETAEGAALARDRASSPDFPVPLTRIVRPHLDLLGLDVVGQWIVAPDADGAPRYRAWVEARQEDVDRD